MRALNAKGSAWENVRPKRRIDGVLLLNKPVGMTSNAALQQLKRLFAAERAGHTGTLDPMASGLLPICLGEATKFASELLECSKQYVARIRLGERTDTGDAEGTVIERREVAVSAAQLVEALGRFRGDIEQIPPMYSAIKHQGRPLYQYARRGTEVERKPRRVHVSAIELRQFAASEALVALTCSKGTYVRVLAEDLGLALGCGAHLSGLERTGVGALQLAQAHGLDELARLDDAGRCARLQPVDSLLKDRPSIAISDPLLSRFLHGQSIRPGGELRGKVRVYGPGGLFLGVAMAGPCGVIEPLRLLRQDSP